MVSHVQVRGVVPRIQYTADGSSQTYEFPFAVFEAGNIKVYLDDTLQASTAYTVTGVRDSDGGSVTFTTAPAQGVIVTIVRDLAIERTTDFQEGGALRANTLNDELDYQIACQQQIADHLNRSMVLPPYAIDSNVNLTLPTPVAGKAIVWNSDGTNLENSTVEVNALESTLKGYKEAAESAASTAAIKAGIASDKADIATTKAQLASDKADIATEQAQIATTKATEVSTALSTKANIALDNLSATGKSAITALVIPDYSSAIANISFPYTAPSAGMVKLAFITTSGTASYALVNSLNPAGRVGSRLTSNWIVQDLFVNAGDIVSIGSGSVTQSECCFIPLKGAVNA